MESYPLFSIIVLNYNGKKVLLQCMDSVLKTEYPNFEVILVDNHSSDGSIEEAEVLFKGLNIVKIIKNPAPLFYTGGCNIGFNHSKGKYILFLTNDTEVDANWLIEIHKAFQDKKVGAVSPKVLYYYDPGIIDNLGQNVDIFGFGFGRSNKKTDTKEYERPEEIFAANGVAIAVRRDLFELVGLFDDRYLFYYEDLDLSWRIRLCGFKIVTCPAARVFHKVSKTTRVFSSTRELSFHARKNRIATLIKNYSLVNVFIIMPASLLLYLLIYIKEAIFDRNLPMANTIVLSIKWNIQNFPYLASKRKIVQSRIRKVRDSAITKLMFKLPLLFKYGA